MRFPILAIMLAPLFADCASALNGTERTHVAQSFEGLLYEREEGEVWVSEIPEILGMTLLRSGEPAYRLSPSVADKFRPLVMKHRGKRKDGSRIEYIRWPFPRASEEVDPTLIVCFEGRGHLVKGAPLGSIRGYPRRFFSDYGGAERVVEITDARLVSVERITREWLATWERLDQTVKDIVAATLEPPGRKKKKRLTELIEQGSRDLKAMIHPEIDEDWRDLLHEIDPHARIGIARRHRMACEWGRLLQICVDRLGINPGTPLQPLPQWQAARTILAESDSLEDFVPQLKAVYGEAALQQKVLEHSDLGGPIYAWQIAEGSPELYALLRAEVRSWLSRILGPNEPEVGEPNLGKVALDEFGLVVRPLDRRLRTKKMVLAGYFVDEVLPGGEERGVRDGDVIVTCRSFEDLRMGKASPTWGVCTEKAYEKRVRGDIAGWFDRGKGRIRPGTPLIRGSEIVDFGED